MGAAAGKEETDSSSVDHNVIGAMSCEACTVRFTVLKRRKNCTECMRTYCSHCAPKAKTGVRRCDRCQFLVGGTFSRSDLHDYKAKELRHFLTKRKVASVESCREKNDLIDLLMRYSNNTQYRQEQAQNELRRQMLQAQARANLQSPPHQPEPPSYSSIVNDEPRDQQPSRDQRQSSDTTKPDLPPRVPKPQPREPDGSQSQPVPNSAQPAGQGDNSPQGQGQNTESASSNSDNNRQGDDITQNMDEGHFSEGNRTSQQQQSQQSQQMQPSVPEPVPQTTTSTNSQKPPSVSQEQEQPSPIRKKFLLSDVKTEEEIASLSGRQLKELLERNFVDYKGCVEKHELITRVTRLWRTHQLNRQTADSMAQGDETTGGTELCKICMDAVVDCVLLECGHMLTCTACGKQLAECPICRQFVIRVVHVFKS